MEGYKVIKDFSFAEKGDVFTKVEDLNLWELQKSEVVSDTETYTSMAFDSSTMEELANKDYVIWYSEEVEKDNNEIISKNYSIIITDNKFKCTSCISIFGK